MGRSHPRRGVQLVVLLLQLRRHMETCHQCKPAISAMDYDLLCEESRGLIINVARRWERNIAGRLLGRKSDTRTVYPCPNINAHGKEYAIAAEQCVVTSTVDTLF